MTFLFSDDGISKVWYQVTQETAISIRVDMWGLLDANYHRGSVEGSEQVRSAFAQELVDRFPTKPIEALADDYPEVDSSSFELGVTPEAMTWFGFVVNGVNYVGGCQTRYGIYPYCESMRAPSYSTAKSAFAAVALMRLAQKYDQDVGNLLIEDYVPEAADSIGDWSAVTFDYVLDMATGNYRSPGRMVDEEHWDTDPFWLDDYYDGKIAAAFNWPHSAPPGTVWVYRTFDTFIVTRAMQNYLQTQAGADADIFDFVVEEVYKPLKMGPGVFSTLRTKDNNWHGQPYGGYGLWWIPDDLAKLTTFLNANHGVIDGEQILQPDLLDDTLQRDPNDRGVDRDGNGKYNNAFWADEHTLGDGSDCKFWVPHMYGYSGILVALMPNGTAYYYASDNQEFTSTAAIQESGGIISMCSE
jgi:CubicO group peptidase (beta-lactamase class C family)